MNVAAHLDRHTLFGGERVLDRIATGGQHRVDAGVGQRRNVAVVSDRVGILQQQALRRSNTSTCGSNRQFLLSSTTSFLALESYSGFTAGFLVLSITTTLATPPVESTTRPSSNSGCLPQTSTSFVASIVFCGWRLAVVYEAARQRTPVIGPRLPSTTRSARRWPRTGATTCKTRSGNLAT